MTGSTLTVERPSIYPILAVNFVGALGFSIVLPFLSKTTDQRTQGAVQGFAGSLNAVASIVGLLAGGLLFGVIGGQVFLLSAALTALVFLLAVQWAWRLRQMPSP